MSTYAIPGNGWKLHRTLLVCSICLTLFLGAVYFFHPPIVQTFVLKSLDQVRRFSGTADESAGRVVVVAVDDPSLKQYGQWPWPREQLAELLARIQEGGAAVIGVEILLSEKDRPDDGDRPGGDELLAKTLADGPFVLGYSFLFSGDTGQQYDCNLHPAYPILVGRKGVSVPYDSFHRAQDVVCNLQALMEAAPDSGFLNGTPDSDGLLRRLPLIIEYRDRLYPSFELSMMEQLHPDGNLIISRDKSNITTLSIRSLDIPTDNNGNFLLGHDLNGRETFISAAAVLNNEVSQDVFRDAAVIVGIDAAGLSRQYATPFSPNVSSLAIHRNALDSLLYGSAPVRTGDFVSVETLVSVVACLLLAAAAIYLPIPLAVAAALAGTVLSWFGAVQVFGATGYLFSPLLPSITLILNLFLLITLRYRQSQLDARVAEGSALSRLEISKQEMKAILNTVPDVIYRLDPEGRITFVSPAVEKYHVTRESLIGSSIFDLVAAPDLNKAKYAINERRTGERGTQGVELRLRLSEKDKSAAGEARFFSVSAEGIFDRDESGKSRFLGTQGIIRDINEQKLLETQLIKAQQLEVMGKLASRVAHDLNNILSGLVSYPDLLLHDLDPSDPMYDNLVVIRNSGERAAHIVQDLLMLARRSTRATEVCDVKVLVAEFMECMELEQLRRVHPDIQFVTKLAPDLMKVKGAMGHLSKVLMNVVRNGLEAMADEGQGCITITARNIYLDKEIEGYETVPQGEYVCLSVADTGIGIEETELRRVFEPFYSKKHQDARGTGLGMTIIWVTVKDHSGFVDIQSTPGEGTEFFIYLPVTQEVAWKPETRAARKTYTGTEVVLVVDDAVDQLEIARAALGSLGYTVLTAESGEDAVRVVEQQPIDLVLFDLVMPGGMGGAATYREIVSRYERCKGIATSGFFDPDSQEELEALGVKIFLDKPYTIEKLSQVVRAELDRKDQNIDADTA